MQRAIAELERLSLELPALCAHATRARAAYYLLRGRPHAAIPLLDEALRATPLSVVGLTRSLGTLAQAYNAIGEHARARQICLSALSQLDAEDLMFCALHLNVQIQAALAQAGLGKLATAARELDALIEKHAAAGGPLTLGALHEARARVAVLAGDERGFSEHLTALESWYLPTGIGSLITLCRRLRTAHAGLPTRAQPPRAWE
jgi:tetratricopeptide (TPR) repeat protein